MIAAVLSQDLGVAGQQEGIFARYAVKIPVFLCHLRDPSRGASL